MTALNEAETRYWQDTVEALQATFAAPRPVAKVLAYLLLQDKPLTLDEIAGGAQMAKSAASVAANACVRGGSVRRVAIAGTNMRAYEIAQDGSDQAVVDSLMTFASQLANTADQFVKGAKVASSKVVRERLQVFSDVYRLQAESLVGLCDGLRRQALTSVEAG